MAKRNEELAQLIASMTANEKRYFVLRAGAGKSKNYLTLYKLLLNPKKPVSSRLAETLGPHVNVAYERLQLRKMLLRAIRNFHEGNSVETKVYTGMVNIELLFNKGQYELCMHEVENCMALAVENELFSAELQLIQWYRWILLRQNKYNTLTGIGRQLFTQEMDCIDKARSVAVLKDLKTQFVELMLDKDRTGNENTVQLKKIISHPMLKNVNEAKSFKGQVLYYEILSWYYRERHETKQAFELHIASVNLFANNPKKIAQLPQIYISFLSNLIIVCHYLKRYDIAEQGIEKIETAIEDIKKSSSKNFEAPARQILLEKKMAVFLYSHRFKEGIALYQQHAKQIAGGQMQPEAAMYLYYQAALCYLYTNCYAEALKPLRIIIDGYDDNTNSEILLMTHMAHIMVHYELGNYSLIRHLLVALRRFIKIKGDNHQAVHLFIKTMGKLIARIYNTKETRHIFSTFMHDCRKIKLANDLRLLSNLDIAFWVEGNLSKK